MIAGLLAPARPHGPRPPPKPKRAPARNHAAVQLLQLIEERFFLASLVADYRISITSSLPTTYKQSQEILSARLAQDHPALTHELLSEMTRRVETVVHVSARAARAEARLTHGPCGRARRSASATC